MPESQRAALIQALPYGRRYARALTRSQSRGDLLVAESLRTLTTSRPTDNLPALCRLYQEISRHFTAQTEHVPADDTSLSLVQRQLLLLLTLEEVSPPMAAKILDLSEAQAAQETERAYTFLKTGIQTSVLIIEDEPIIAMDIEELVLQCGHKVAGVAHTQEDAIRIARETRPGLILADINLGAGGDGMRAVAEITKTHDAPVIYVTAYPERLLTGETSEPSFVITKPFEPLTLAVATYQAVSRFDLARP
ncbi:two-component response regulator [Acetobacter indonesiensis NRIC 0313]|uniref:Regulator n=1 Tax=Acetobacter indonesiensis TaxID=104101 RepID=A0A252AUP7_9PROT|nr:response regulator [Acetobacter indonesiensis]OUI94194.1 regulator [Acetobacter indonesiensis]GAN63957.1 two component transcriptional regulator [Acetobacter indonesiensis]GBQ59944.1 two-component response regulator [Acetobacter indonesiensis NRIC 0313]GEN02774.1 two-component response regulator [Acetobacter indonesiensis]